MHVATGQRELFERLPDGLVYRPDFLAPDVEQALITEILTLSLQEARYRAFTAKRRILSFGFGYDFTTNAPVPAPPLPPFLHPVRERVSEWTRIPAPDLVQCTIAEYGPGTQLGWHRDVPTFGFVVGVSLASPCRMRLRPYPHVEHAKQPTLVLVLEPRSAYVLRDAARWRWQHAISPTKVLRYSITFRTMRRREGDREAAALHHTPGMRR